MSTRYLLQIISLVTLFLPTSSAWADWAEVGAAYKCTDSYFALYATVESSGGNITAPPEMKPLKIGSNHLSCDIEGTAVVAVVDLSGPGHNGMCGDPGTVTIRRMQVGGTDLIVLNQMAFCDQQPSIVHVEVSKAEHGEGVSVSICKGIWKWGSSYENVECDSKRLTQHGKITDDAKTP